MKYLVLIKHADGTGGESISKTPEDRDRIYQVYKDNYAGTTTMLCKHEEEVMEGRPTVSYVKRPTLNYEDLSGLPKLDTSKDKLQQPLF